MIVKVTEQIDFIIDSYSSSIHQGNWKPSRCYNFPCLSNRHHLSLDRSFTINPASSHYEHLGEKYHVSKVDS